MTLSWLFFAIALLTGMLITVQTGSNARLKEAFGEALPAVIASSCLGVILAHRDDAHDQDSLAVASLDTRGGSSCRLSTPSARSELHTRAWRLARGARDPRLERSAREVDLRGTTRSDNRRGIVKSTRRGPLTRAVGRGERP